MSTVGWVYFIQQSDAVKIGWSRNVDARMRALQTAASAPLRLLGTLAGTREVERSLHKRFRALRTHGEWFRATDDLIRVIPWLCDSDAQDAARNGALASHWWQVLVHASNALSLLQPEPHAYEDVPDAYLVTMHRWLTSRISYDCDEARQAAQASVLEVSDRMRKFGPFAERPVNDPKRPTHKEVRAVGLQAAEDIDASRPGYLDLRAIFDDEIADEVAA